MSIVLWCIIYKNMMKIWEIAYNPIMQIRVSYDYNLMKERVNSYLKQFIFCKSLNAKFVFSFLGQWETCKPNVQLVYPVRHLHGVCPGESFQCCWGTNPAIRKVRCLLNTANSVKLWEHLNQSQKECIWRYRFLCRGLNNSIALKIISLCYKIWRQKSVCK